MHDWWDAKISVSDDGVVPDITTIKNFACQILPYFSCFTVNIDKRVERKIVFFPVK